MELGGLKRTLYTLSRGGITYQVLVTDRHGQARKFMRTEQKNTRHYFDVFHVTKCEYAILNIDKSFFLFLYFISMCSNDIFHRPSQR